MTFFIAEICSNHLNNIQRSKKLIDEAKRIGCDAVKFQLFKSDKLFAPEILKKSKSHRKIKSLELSQKLIPILSRYARRKGLLFGCTPFDLEAVDDLKKHVDFYKIGSYELLRLDIFKKCIKNKKDIIFSTGMATELEIKKVLNIFKINNFYKFSILRCVSNYPTKLDKVNLQSIETLNSLLKRQFPNKKIKVGWSDHTKDESVILKSIYKYDVDIIEFHLDLDGKGPEYEGGHCWLPSEIISAIRHGKYNKKIDGNGKIHYQSSEFGERKWRSDPKDGLRPMISERKKYK
jgi:N-acetylneuraminate synthase